MRIRTIKPEFWRSDDITALDWPTRLLFIGLWSYVDDNGVGIDDERRVTADLFGLEDDPIAIRDMVRDGLATLSRRSLIVRYEVGGTRWLAVVKWADHQKIDKPGKVRYPSPCQAESVVNAGVQATTAPGGGTIRDTLATVSRLEQGNRGTREQGRGRALTRRRLADVESMTRGITTRTAAHAGGTGSRSKRGRKPKPRNLGHRDPMSTSG